MKATAAKLGIDAAETVRTWVRRAEVESTSRAERFVLRGLEGFSIARREPVTRAGSATGVPPGAWARQQAVSPARAGLRRAGSHR